MYQELLHDAKALNLNDKAFRVLIDAFCFAAKSPATLQRRGWLYHNEGFPVSLADFVRVLPITAENTPERIQKALDELCSMGGAKHSFLVWSGKRRAWRVRNWRKWQEGLVTEFCQNFATNQPENSQEKTDLDVRRQTLDLDTTDGRKDSHPKLTSEQTQVKQRLIDHYRACMVQFCNDDKPEFKGGAAARFFKEQIQKGRGEDLLRATIDEFFLLRQGVREGRQERAERGGFEPTPVDVTFNVYQSKFQGLFTKVKGESGGTTAVGD